MQGQRSIMEFDQGSSSSNSAIDPQVYWSNMLNPIDSRDIAECLLAPDDTIMPLANGPNPDGGSFSSWNFSSPESNGNPINHSIVGEAKRDHDWASTLVSSTDVTSSHEVRFDAGNTLPLENMAINTGGNQITRAHEYDTLQSSVFGTEFVGSNGQQSEAGLCHLLNSRGPDARQIQSVINPTNSSCISAGHRFIPEDVDSGLRGSLDGQRMAGKRKVLEGTSGQSSSGNVKCLHQGENSQQGFPVRNTLSGGLNISGSSDNQDTNTIEGSNPSIDNAIRAVISGCRSSASASRNSENVHRAVRRRIHTASEHGLSLPNLWPPGNSNRHPAVWSSHQPSSSSIPFIQLPDVGPVVSVPVSQTQSTVPNIPSFMEISDSFPWNGTSSSRISTSSGSPAISGERFPSRRIVRSIPIPVADIRRLAQDPTNWNTSSGNVSPTGNVPSATQSGSISASLPFVSPTWPSHQIPSIQYPLRLSDFHNSFSLAGSGSGVQSNSISLQGPNNSSSSQEVIPNLGMGSRSQQRQLLRSAFLMDRQNSGVLGVPVPFRIAAAREGRSRMLSEIRNALEFIRRGDNSRFESLLFGGADLHDRHRDMRLDVDNMSYEELLALEERIGNVSTGLTEEVVSKHLKQRMYRPDTTETPIDVEPCCICQEEYVEGDGLGTLNCGHDFHTKCIEQWLSHKNLCPICKMTALIT